jgi:uncharacterized OsmC-like protein
MRNFRAPAADRVRAGTAVGAAIGWQASCSGRTPETTVIELIWDRGRSGTATAPAGASVTVGDDADFSPDDLAAAAAAACLMRTFLERGEQAEIPVLSYASAAHLETTDPTRPPHVVIRCYIVTAESVRESEIRRVLAESVGASAICRLLGDRLTCQADIRRLCGLCAV